MKDSDVIYVEARGDDTRASLLERLKIDDRESWNRFVMLYSPLIVYWCRQNNLQEADVQDVGQEVFRVVNRSIAKFRPRQQPGGFRGWLRSITTNKIRDLERHRLRHPGGFGEGGAASFVLPERPVPEVATDEVPDDSARDQSILLRRVIDLMLARKEQKTRDAFKAVVLDGMPVREVAKRLGMSPSSVYVIKCRILQQIRAEFLGMIDLPPLEQCD